MFDDPHSFALIKDAFGKLEKHSVDDVLVAIRDKLSESSGISTLVNAAEYAASYNSPQAQMLYIKALELSFVYDNIAEKAIKIISELPKLSENIRNDSKSDFMSVLHIGFINTSSEILRREIVRVVKSCRWVRQFKALLKGNEEGLDIYNKLAK